VQKPGNALAKNDGNKSRENNNGRNKMTTKILRKIIQIDEMKCNGCGECLNSCAEGALALVNGKARLIKEKYCDGLAACLNECPQGALNIVEREADIFDEEEASRHVEDLKEKKKPLPCGCAGSAEQEIERACSCSGKENNFRQESKLSHWPVQLTLVTPGAKFLDGRDAVLIADCVPFAYPNLHQDFLEDQAVLVACPKLDNAEAHLVRLTEIIKKSNLKSLTVLRMEVPCCSGLTRIARKAILDSGANLNFKEVVIGIKGDLKN
jgi:Pyruvate/2-oxoacid:ferredoxin oxidoreductase delta subunit